MASSSWLPGASSSKSRFLSSSNYELPRWRAPSHMSASIIPPPIVQSTYIAPQQREAAAESAVFEKPSVFEERQHELEADLQFLLDAQAEGLIRGLEGAHLDDRSSTGSTTPTAQSVRSASTRTRKPARRRPGLRSARKGIYNSIVALSALKDDELQDVNGQINDHQSNLDQIENWEKKRKGLRKASENVNSSEETVRVQRLQQDADSLQAEINQVELQLAEMKSRHRKLLKKATEIENNVQARMASYTSSLRLLEDDVQKFLSINPKDGDATTDPQDGKQSMWQLPPKRRTLDMARDCLNEQHAASLEQRKKHEHEKTALADGAALWKEAVTEVTEFEKRVRGEMASLRPTSPNSQSAWEDPPQNDSADRLKELLKNMDIVIESLQTKHKTAEGRNWLLLVAAVGAELDALRRGKDILSGVLNTQHDDLIDTNNHDLVKTDSSEEIHALDKSFETARPIGSNISDGGDDHDEPDPELLFSRQDTDTE